MSCSFRKALRRTAAAVAAAVLVGVSASHVLADTPGLPASNFLEATIGVSKPPGPPGPGGGGPGGGGGTIIVVDPPAAGPGVSATVRPGEEVTIATRDGRISVTVPAGALQRVATITLVDMAGADQPRPGTAMVRIDDLLFGIVIEDETGNLLREFAVPLLIGLIYDTAALPDGFSADDLQVYYWDEDFEAWIAIPTTVGPNGTVRATVDHLTVFALMASKHAPRLSDISGHWGEADILKLVSLGIVSGVGGGKFDPDGTVTRAQFARMVVGAMGLQSSDDASPDFTDSADIPDWAVGYVATAVAHGIVRGMDDGSFRPNAPITREQMAVMIARALRLPLAGDTDFIDNDAISDWARSAVKAVADEGIIAGVGGGRFAPAANATRAQAARMLSRLLLVRLAR